MIEYQHFDMGRKVNLSVHFSRKGEKHTQKKKKRDYLYHRIP